jgi:transposase
MYIRKINRHKDGKDHAYWALVESYRTSRGPRQRTVAYLGELDKSGRIGIHSIVDEQAYAQKDLFESSDPEWVEVNIKGIRTERVRDFGDIWLAFELLKRLGLYDFFKSSLCTGREKISWADLACILIIARFCNPSSELYIAEHYYGHSALQDLIGISNHMIYENRLYRALDKLLPHKRQLERHLKERLGDLFEIKYDLLLYDVTSTYFEGEAKSNPQAKRGYSRDKRPDCKQICIALVVTREGLPLGYEIFDGNRKDDTTVKEIVKKMEDLYGSADRIWVMDRGMLSKTNIEYLKATNRKYIIGTPKSELKNFEQEILSKDWQEIYQGLEVQRCASPNGDDEIFILCRSADRFEKDKAILERFINNIELGLEKINISCQKGRLKQSGLAERRIGRLLQRNCRAARLFDIKVEQYDNNKLILKWTKHKERSNWAQLIHGCYILRSNIKELTAEDLWQAYVHLTDAESAFRIQKSDLKIRPIWHQKAHRVQAHIFVCFLSFVVWKCLAQMCKKCGLGNEPRKVIDEIRRIKLTDVVLPTKKGIDIKLRCVSKPDSHQKILLQYLDLKMPGRLTKNYKM